MGATSPLFVAPDQWHTALMLYAVKLGPIETDEGNCFAYLGFTEDVALPPAMAMRDDEGLRELAKIGSGHQLHCEPRLAKAGKKLGFVATPMPKWASEGRGFIALQWGLAPFSDLLPEHMDLPALLAATAEFVEAQPWLWWGDSDPLIVSVMGGGGKVFEGVLLGSGGEEFGVALYENKGAVRRIVELMDAGDFKRAAKEPCLGLTLEFEPEWMAEAVNEAYGTGGLPLPMKSLKGKSAPIDATSLAILIATLDSAAKLKPGNLFETAEASVEGRRIRISVEAPPPTRD